MSIQNLLQFPHFILISLGILSAIISVIFIFFHKPKEKWYLLHKIFTSIGIVLMLVGVFFLGILSLTFWHAYLGFSAIIIVFITIFFALIQLKKKKKKLRLIHIWTGRIVLLLLIVVMLIGLSYYL
ncbi:hypothetical protein DSAG12_01315 [Promethearchaeum syntrophicum]|uniref:Cytochrome b561 domain-containing protein n=1 Tax=Promethearchaeum syntrophicum TaxID=2594042 RepID=A0A5B9D8M4_9ARCH|nr:hypothetical protein [Candidatus Prometheoarchaeum syntrophicum]QEE15489.1 hypothetical protein DSAG12_01315 [Candidatus Prometheoarchaeum syntrophicum]